MIFVLAWLSCVLLSGTVGQLARGQWVYGCALGMLLGIFGVLLIPLLPDKRTPACYCFACRKRVDSQAIICPYCRMRFGQSPATRPTHP